MATEPSVLLFGSNGQLGWTFRQHLPAERLTVLDRQAADLTNPEAIRAAIRTHRPNIILNAAAYTAVDKAQSEPELAHQINAVAPGVMAEEAQALGACLVHFSTDYVFAGEGTQPYRESDATGPLSVYGQTKLAGEQAVQQACARHLIFRTSWVVGEHGGNFMKTMLRLAAERDSLRVVADQHGAPTSTDLIAHTTLEVLKQMRADLGGPGHVPHSADAGAWAPANDTRWGLYHLAAAGETTWHAYACHAIARAAARGWPMRASAPNIEAIATDQYPLPAPRPANSRLNTQRLQSRFGVELPDWRVGVDAVLDSLQPSATI
jgi:dTDP-4-dehydrorhamnose reductase